MQSGASLNCSAFLPLSTVCSYKSRKASAVKQSVDLTAIVHEYMKFFIFLLVIENSKEVFNEVIFEIHCLCYDSFINLFDYLFIPTIQFLKYLLIADIMSQWAWRIQ